MIGFVFGLLADGACLQHHHVSFLHVGRRTIAELFQLGRHAPRVGIVHLTAGDPEVVGLCHPAFVPVDQESLPGRWANWILVI